jgi:hypothetical protein
MAVTLAVTLFCLILPPNLGSRWTDVSAGCFLAQDTFIGATIRVIFPFFGGGSYDELIFLLRSVVELFLKVNSFDLPKITSAGGSLLPAI